MCLSGDDYRRLTRMETVACSARARHEAAAAIMVALESLGTDESGETLFDKYWLTRHLGRLLIELGDEDGGADWLLKSIDYWDRHQRRCLV